jgi:uncharacterized membrane protein YcaP (DUF421 family)
MATCAIGAWRNPDQRNRHGLARRRDARNVHAAAAARPGARDARSSAIAVMLFENWHATLDDAIRAAVAYLVIVAALRAIGEQALAKMRAYDLIVTITLGSVMANIAFSRDTALVDGIAIMTTFVLMQEMIRWAQARSKTVRKIVIEPPRLIVWDGHVLADRLRRWHLTIDEIRAAVRRAGVAGISEVQAVVLENDGDWSVVRRRDCGADRSAFEGLDIPKPTAE